MNQSPKQAITIWLINPYGPIPGEGWRPYRFELIGRALAEKGYTVVWWTSTFSHHFKRQRAGGWEDRALSANFTLRLVPSPAYKKNIGMGRGFRDLVFGFRTFLRGVNQRQPDLILFYESPFTFGLAGFWLGRWFRTKMIFDQVDLWPEIIETALSRTAKLVTRPVIALAYIVRAIMYRRLHGSVALAKPYLEVMHRHAPILQTFPSAVAYNGIDISSFRSRMSGSNVRIDVPLKKQGDVWAIFAGSLGDTYDIAAILEAARSLRWLSSLRFFIAGDGPLRASVTSFSTAVDNSNLHYLGKLNPETLIALYGYCDIGLCAYSSRSNVEMPDKIYDYTAAGLAVVNSLTGEVASLIDRKRFGVQYRAGDARDLAEKLMVLVKDASVLELMKKCSFEAGEEFDQSMHVGKIIQVVEDVLGSR